MTADTLFLLITCVINLLMAFVPYVVFCEFRRKQLVSVVNGVVFYDTSLSLPKDLRG
jgi:hypothetical protein